MTADPILESFAALLRNDPDRTLLISPGQEFTVARVDTLARETESRLQSAMGPAVAGMPVALAAANGPGFLAGLLALRRRQAAAVLLQAGHRHHLTRERAQSLGVGWVLSCEEEWPQGASGLRVTPSHNAAEPPPQSTLPAEVAVVKLTSGSTGQPRGVMASSAALVADDRALAAAMGLRRDDRILAAIPFSHSYGFASVVLPALMRGSVLVLPQAGNPFHVLQAGAWGKATFFPTIPAWAEAMVRMSRPPACPPTLRLIISAGAPLRPATARRFREVYGRRIHVFYGSSETGGICYDRRGDAAERGTLGTPVEGVEIHLDSPSQEECFSHFSKGSADQPGGRGLVTLTSPAVAEGYWPQASPDLAGGRFRTRDLAEFRGDELALLGRVDDLINIKGKKVNPREIEEVLRRAPGVEDVAVLGVPRPEGAGDLVRAFVACGSHSLTYRELHDYCRRRLASHKVPRSFLVLGSLPVNARGKVDRAALRNLAPPKAQ